MNLFEVVFWSNCFGQCHCFDWRCFEWSHRADQVCMDCCYMTNGCSFRCNHFGCYRFSGIDLCWSVECRANCISFDKLLWLGILAAVGVIWPQLDEHGSSSSSWRCEVRLVGIVGEHDLRYRWPCWQLFVSSAGFAHPSDYTTSKTHLSTDYWLLSDSVHQPPYVDQGFWLLSSNVILDFECSDF